MAGMHTKTVGCGPHETTKPGAPQQLYNEVPIDSGADEIRLLRVNAGGWDDNIQCDLFAAALSEKPVYSALSYVWANYTTSGGLEDTQDCYIIDIRGYHFPVGRNLYRALRRLRALYTRRQSPLVLWVDAICIDQSDVLQRNHQVNMMGAIYSGCRECHIWLQNMTSRTGWSDQGRETWEFSGDQRDFDKNWEGLMDSCTFSDSSRTFDSIKSIRLGSNIEKYSLHVAWYFRFLAMGMSIDEILPFHNTIWNRPEVQTDYLHGMKCVLQELCEDSWHSRLWVVQEAVLPQRAVVHFYSVSMPIDVFFRAAEEYEKDSPNRSCFISYSSNMNTRVCIENLLDGFADINDCRHLTAQRPALFDVCLRFSHRRATEAHDYVYALLGLASRSTTPDYLTHPKDVFRQLCEEHIIATRSLLPLLFANFHGDPKRRSLISDSDLENTVPSWAVDWGDLAKRDFGGNGLGRRYSLGHIRNSQATGGTLQQDPWPRIDGRRLFISGNRFDVVLSISDMSAGPTREDESTGRIEWAVKLLALEYATMTEDLRLNALEILSGLDRIPHSKDQYVGGGTWLNAWCRTLYMDHRFEPKHDVRLDSVSLNRAISLARAILMRVGRDPDFKPGISKSLEENMASHPDSSWPRKDGMGSLGDVFLTDAILEDMLTTMDRTCHNQKLFTTQRGYLGMASAVQLGDVIFLIPGSPVPVILRERTIGNEIPGSPTEYEVVSSCYIHGIMQGEAFPENMKGVRELIIT